MSFRNSSILLFGVICSLVLFAPQAKAQFKLGLRAGINLANINGESEKDDAGNELENNALRTRIAVGLTGRWKAGERFGLSGELLFIQKGSYYRYEGASYMAFPELNNQVFEGHNRVMAINIINGYLEVPVSFYYEIVDDKLMLDAGVAAGFLITSRGLGVLKYTDAAAPDDLIEYDLDYRYNSDKAGAVTTSSNTTVTNRTGRIAGTTIVHPSSIGAYYFDAAKTGNFYNVFDLSVNVGLSFYLSEGLRFGTRFQYSLLDITNNQYDKSLYKLDANRLAIPRSDIDKNIGVQVFIGLQF
jgi:hypothetical protein